MRWWFFIIFIFIGCREIIPVEPRENISGYQINGFITNQSGTPLKDVIVKVLYQTTLVNNNPLDTVIAVITDTNSLVSIDVYNTNNIFIRNIFLGRRPIGPINRVAWNGELVNGDFISSGYYLIRVRINNTFVKEYPVIIDGSQTAKSDSGGQFIITNANLPVNKLFDRYDSQNRYLGTYRILSSVILELIYLNVAVRGRVDLLKDEITKVNIII